MDQDVTWAHRLADLALNLAHTVLVANGLGNHPLSLLLAHDVAVKLRYQLGGRPLLVHV